MTRAAAPSGSARGPGLASGSGEHPHVRRYVRGLLENAGSYAALDPGERKRLAGALVKVLSYLTDETGGVAAPALVEGAASAPAGALEVGSNEALKSRLADDPALVGSEFKAGAAREGAQAFEKLVSAVDFPHFVSSLIEGVYSSIVSSSIKQMQAYGKLIEAVAKSAEQFAQENITLEAARSYVASSFPRAVVYDRSRPDAKLQLQDDLEQGDQPDFKLALGMAENVSLDDEESETKVVLAAQLKLARQRQQQLALMLVLGINRIIVTDGEIKAAVLFDVKSTDRAARDTSASSYDSAVLRREEGGGWFDDSSSAETKVSSAWSEEQDRSGAQLDARAKLSGNVTVRFRSETFPLERLASGDELGLLQEKSARGPRAARA
jgi:hypothetical protein